MNDAEARLCSDENSEEDQNKQIVVDDKKLNPQILILNKGEPMETNSKITEVEKSMTPLESALESALLFGENMYFSVMAMNTAKNLTDPSTAPPNLTPEAYAAFCEYTAELFAVAAAARQELNDISA